MFFEDKLEAIAAAVSDHDVSASHQHEKNAYIFSTPGEDAELRAWIVAQVKKLCDRIGIDVTDETGFATSCSYDHILYSRQTLCAWPCVLTGTTDTTDEPRQTETPMPRRQRLSLTEVLSAFRGMGYVDKRELMLEKQRLMTDMSYAKDWMDPRWLMQECALGDCAVRGQIQYVARVSEVCAWCTKHALQDYM